MKSIYFYIKIIVICSLLFVFHLFILKRFEIELFSNKIIESYLINIFSALLLYFIIDKLKYKFKDSLGFIFMFNSFFKFALFFILIYPTYLKDGISTKLEFSTFFIPYVVCLIIETHALIKLLTNLDNEMTLKQDN